MIKIILLCSLFLCCGTLGINVGNVYKNKHKFYIDLLDFCNDFKNNISFLKTDIISIIEKNCYSSKLSQLLNDVKNLINDKVIIEKKEFIVLLDKYNFLNEQDTTLLTSLFCEIGSLGYDEQISKIEYSIESVKNTINDFEQNKLKYVSLSKKMGFVIGLLVCIVLI